MSGRITSSPEAKHHCNAGWRVESDEEVAAREARAVDGNAWFPSLPAGMRMLIEDHPWPDAGTIWTCDDCGMDWKATYPYVNVLSPTWVRRRPLPPPFRWPWRRRKEAE